MSIAAHKIKSISDILDSREPVFLMSTVNIYSNMCVALFTWNANFAFQVLSSPPSVCLSVCCLCVCLWLSAVFLWRFRRNPSLWDDAVSDVCVSVRSCHLLLGIPRLSKFGTCDPWQILRIYFFQNFKISKIFGEFFYLFP